MKSIQQLKELVKGSYRPVFFVCFSAVFKRRIGQSSIEVMLPSTRRGSGLSTLLSSLPLKIVTLIQCKKHTVTI